MSARSYADIRNIMRDKIEPVTRKSMNAAGIKAHLWGAEIHLSRAVPENTVYVCASEEDMGLTSTFTDSKSDGIVFQNSRGISVITVTRKN